MRKTARNLCGLTAFFLAIALYSFPALAVPLSEGDVAALVGVADPFGALVPAASTGPIAFSSSSAGAYAGTITQDVFTGTTIDGITGVSFRYTISTTGGPMISIESRCLIFCLGLQGLNG